MISPRFYLFLVLLMFIMYASSIEYTGSLTSSECRAYFASDDVNKNLQALFSCPKKWRVMPRKRLGRTGESSSFIDEQFD